MILLIYNLLSKPTPNNDIMAGLFIFEISISIISYYPPAAQAIAI